MAAKKPGARADKERFSTEDKDDPDGEKVTKEAADKLPPEELTTLLPEKVKKERAAKAKKR